MIICSYLLYFSCGDIAGTCRFRLCRQVGQAGAFQADRRRVALRYWQSKGPKPEKDSDSSAQSLWILLAIGHR